jgi:hypothetical protein
MNLRSTIPISLSLFALLALSAHAEEQRIYQTDSLGNIQYNKHSFAIQKDDRIIECHKANMSPTVDVKLAVSIAA